MKHLEAMGDDTVRMSCTHTDDYLEVHRLASTGNGRALLRLTLNEEDRANSMKLEPEDTRQLVGILMRLAHVDAYLAQTLFLSGLLTQQADSRALLLRRAQRDPETDQVCELLRGCAACVRLVFDSKSQKAALPQLADQVRGLLDAATRDLSEHK